MITTKQLGDACSTLAQWTREHSGPVAHLAGKDAAGRKTLILVAVDDEAVEALEGAYRSLVGQPEGVA